MAARARSLCRKDLDQCRQICKLGQRELQLSLQWAGRGRPGKSLGADRPWREREAQAETRSGAGTRRPAGTRSGAGTRRPARRRPRAVLTCGGEANGVLRRVQEANAVPLRLQEEEGAPLQLQGESVVHLQLREAGGAHHQAQEARGARRRETGEVHHRLRRKSQEGTEPVTRIPTRF